MGNKLVVVKQKQTPNNFISLTNQTHFEFSCLKISWLFEKFHLNIFGSRLARVRFFSNFDNSFVNNIKSAYLP